MKKWFLALTVAGMMMSCGADEATVDNMTDEMCDALEGTDIADPMQLMTAANKLTSIAEKEDEYSTVTEAQLEEAMKAKCPEGWKNFEALKAMGGE